MAENTLSQNVAQAISDFGSIKTAIENKGVTVETGTPTSEYADLIGDIPSGSDNLAKSIIERSATSIAIPSGVTSIGAYAFYKASGLTAVTLPDSLNIIHDYAFSESKLTSITTPIKQSPSYINIENSAFASCSSLVTANIQSGCLSIGSMVFNYCRNLTTLYLSNTIVQLQQNSFRMCDKLENVTLENGFRAELLDLSASTLYSVSTIVSWLNALYDRTGLSAYTLTIGATNLAKLSSTEIAIATNKNWNLA